MKAQEFIKKYAPNLEGSDSIPFSTVLALMESFKSQEVIDTTFNLLLKVKPQIIYSSETAMFDAILDEDKMTIDLPDDGNVVDDDLHFENHSI